MAYTETKTFTMVHRHSRLNNGCGNDVVNLSLDPSTVYRVLKNDKISRPRPSEPLWKNMTALPLQYRWKQWCQFERKQEVVNSLYRPPPRYRNTPCSFTYLNEICGVTYGLNSSPEKTNWALKARLRVKDELVNLGETLFEYQETARMFRTTAETLYDAYRTVRGRMPYRLQRRLTPASLPAAYIGGEFGVKPLMNDLFLSAMVLQDRIQLPIYRRIFAQDTSGVKGRDGWYRSDRATFYMELEPNRDIVTFGNPFELAWNLIPFSLVVDWVIPIGETLSAMDALKNVKWQMGTLSQKDEFRRGGVPPNPGYTVIRDHKTHYKSHVRHLLPSIPFAESPLRWEPSGSWNHVSKGLALLYLLSGRGTGSTRLPPPRKLKKGKWKYAFG